MKIFMIKPDLATDNYSSLEGKGVGEISRGEGFCHVYT